MDQSKRDFPQNTYKGRLQDICSKNPGARFKEKHTYNFPAENLLEKSRSFVEIAVIFLTQIPILFAF